MIRPSAPKTPPSHQCLDIGRQFPEPEHPARRHRRFNSSDVVEDEPISPVGEVAEVRLMWRQLHLLGEGAAVRAALGPHLAAELARMEDWRPDIDAPPI